METTLFPEVCHPLLDSVPSATGLEPQGLSPHGAWSVRRPFLSGAGDPFHRGLPSGLGTLETSSGKSTGTHTQDTSSHWVSRSIGLTPPTPTGPLPCQDPQHDTGGKRGQDGHWGGAEHRGAKNLHLCSTGHLTWDLPEKGRSLRVQMDRDPLVYDLRCQYLVPLCDCRCRCRCRARLVLPRAL